MMSQGVTFLLSSTHDHHNTDNDHATSPNDHTQDLQANTMPIRPQTATAHHDAKMGTNAQERHQPPFIKTHEQGRDPQTLTTTHHYHAQSTTATATNKVQVLPPAKSVTTSYELQTLKRPWNDCPQPRKAHQMRSGHPSHP